jgi:hypothetical protein
MKTLTLILLLFCQLLSAQNLQADKLRQRSIKEGCWTSWDTISCNVFLEINIDSNLLKEHDVLDRTFTITLNSSGKWYDTKDYENIPLAIVIHLNPDKTYNVLFHMDYLGVGNDYQYLHCQVK